MSEIHFLKNISINLSSNLEINVSSDYAFRTINGLYTFVGKNMAMFPSYVCKISDNMYSAQIRGDRNMAVVST